MDSLEDIEVLAKRIMDLEPCVDDRRFAETVYTERVHLARGPGDSLELFLEGGKDSFGETALGRALEWSTYHDVKTGRDFPALVVRTPGGSVATRLMAHVAYEASRYLAQNPDRGNAELLRYLVPYISLVVPRRLLDGWQQMGLVAELMLIGELLTYCEGLVPPGDPLLVIRAWHGWDSASRDFSGKDIAVEVKATALDTRAHLVQPMYQVLADSTQAEEQVYVFSVGLKPDLSSKFKLITAFDRVYTRLGGVAEFEFLKRIAQYGGPGFDPADYKHYELETGFVVSHKPRLFRVDHLDGVLRPGSFVDGAPPSRVQDLRYRLSLEGAPAVRAAERDYVFRGLL